MIYIFLTLFVSHIFCRVFYIRLKILLKEGVLDKISGPYPKFSSPYLLHVLGYINVVTLFNLCCIQEYFKSYEFKIINFMLSFTILLFTGFILSSFNGSSLISQIPFPWNPRTLSAHVISFIMFIFDSFVIFLESVFSTRSLADVSTMVYKSVMGQ